MSSMPEIFSLLTGFLLHNNVCVCCNTRQYQHDPIRAFASKNIKSFCRKLKIIDK